MNHEPYILNPEPSTSTPNPKTPNPKPQTLSPKPQTPNPQLSTLNDIPGCDADVDGASAGDEAHAPLCDQGAPTPQAIPTLQTVSATKVGSTALQNPTPPGRKTLTLNLSPLSPEVRETKRLRLSAIRANYWGYFQHFISFLGHFFAYNRAIEMLRSDFSRSAGGEAHAPLCGQGTPTPQTPLGPAS